MVQKRHRQMKREIDMVRTASSIEKESMQPEPGGDLDLLMAPTTMH